MSQPIELQFDVKKLGPRLSPSLMGIFFEEINHAGEGGIYAELIGNRSFEDNGGSTSCWQTKGNASMSVVTDRMLTSEQHHALAIDFHDKKSLLQNSGYWGIRVVKGEVYQLSLWMRAKNRTFNGTVTASLVDDRGKSLGHAVISGGVETEWKKYTAEIRATATFDKAAFQLQSSQPASFCLDIVSLFPPTFKNRPNGMRKDLAQMLYDLKPRFVRFPGGCYVEGDERGHGNNRYEWKKTIGPIEHRAGHLNQNWGYYVQDGMGFHEYLQLCEDLEADALFVVNVGLGHNWLQNYRQLDDYVQEALDAIEYANGDISTRWGAERAKNGHPAPFSLKYIEIGNENYNFHMDSNQDQSEHYPERYYTFWKALKKAHPEITLIGNVESWGTDNPSWRNTYPVEMVDEHYYRSPSWFVNNYEKYDDYGRNYAKVYVGEYAVTQGFGRLGNLNAALGEAIFIQGMERNSDIVSMSSYAPIFCHEDAQGWMPDMIRFNNHTSYGTPSYYVQKLFGQNQGYQNIFWTELNNKPQPQASQSEIKQQIGVGTWGTQAVFSKLQVKDASGNLIPLKTDNESDWQPTRGEWQVTASGIQQVNDEENALYINSDALPTDVDIEVTARKTGGREGFLIVFNYQDPNNYSWVNIGGWENSQHAIEQTVNGGRSTLHTRSGNIETGKDYVIKISCRGTNVKVFLNGVSLFDIRMPNGIYDRGVYTSAALDQSGEHLIVKLTNPNATPSPSRLSFEHARVTGASLEILSSESGMDENTTSNPCNIFPKKGEVSINADGTILYEVPPFSLNILTLDIQQKSE